MRNLCSWVILGFLVQSASLHIVTQDDVYREAVTDGYLIDHRFLASLTNKSPQRNTTMKASLQPPSVSKERDMAEGSGDPKDKPTISMDPQHGAKPYAPTTWSVSAAQSSTASPSDTDGSSSDESGSGREEMLLQYPTTNARMLSMFTVESSTPSSTITKPPPSSTITKPPPSSTITKPPPSSTITKPPPSSTITKPPPSLFEKREGSGLGSASGTGSGSGAESGSGTGAPSISNEKSKTQSKMFAPLDDLEEVEIADKVTAGSNTGWITILAFVVGLAALIMLCVAIATRDKWNRLRRASQLQTQTNQQWALERESFLLREQPMENGTAGESTVIPLDERPDKHPSD